MKGLQFYNKFLLLTGAALCTFALAGSTCEASGLTDASATEIVNAEQSVTDLYAKPAFNETAVDSTDYDADPEAIIAASVDVYANVKGTYTENLVDPVTGVIYNIWIPESGSVGKPVIFCITGTQTWANESVGFGPHLVLKANQVTPNAVIVIVQRKKSGPITNSYTVKNLSTFITGSIIGGYVTSPEKVYYYGFSQGGLDFSTFGPLYNWRAAAFSDGYSSAMNAASNCPSLKAVMYNNSTGTPSAWNKATADKSAAKLGLTEGFNYVWNTVNGRHANINQYAVVQAEGQGFPAFSTNCTWSINESNGLPQALNWLLFW